jgi:hypothetical protein
MGDFQTWAIAILGVACSIFGWFGKVMFGAINGLKNDVKDLTKELTDKYVRKDDFSEFRKELLDFMRRIEDKLDKKQDK